MWAYPARQGTLLRVLMWGGGGGGGRGDGGGIGVVGVVNCYHRNQKPKSKPNLETTSISVD